MVGFPGRYSAAAWSGTQLDQWRKTSSSERIYLKKTQPISLQQAIGQFSQVGGVIELGEGSWSLYNSFDFDVDNLTIVGQGRNTILQVAGNTALTWSGTDGVLANLTLRGENITYPRGGSALTITGPRWTGYRVWSTNCNNPIRIDRASDHTHLVECNAESYNGIAFEVYADYCWAYGNWAADSSTVANEMEWAGSNGIIMANSLGLYVGAAMTGVLNVTGTGNIHAGLNQAI